MGFIINKNSYLLLFFFAFILMPICYAYPNKFVSVTSFGARGDGIHDDTEAITNAINFSIDNKIKCFIPSTNSYYLIKSTIRISMKYRQVLKLYSNGATLKKGDNFNSVNRNIWKLTPSFKEECLMSIGPIADTNPFPYCFLKNATLSINISGIKILSDYTSDTTSTITSALDISAGIVHLYNLEIKNFEGYGIRMFGPNLVFCRKLNICNVGGRSKTHVDDAFGDGIYFAGVTAGGLIYVSKSNIVGRKDNNLRSRSGITFEYGHMPYKSIIEECTIQGYAKSVHIEEEASSNVYINSCAFSDFNYCIAMVKNNGSLCSVNNCKIDVDRTDKYDEGSGGVVLNMYGGGNYIFSNSTLKFRGDKNAYITMVGVKRIINCDIHAFGKNPFFADSDILFKKCRFFDFGGISKSFFSVTGKNVFLIQSCKFFNTPKNTFYGVNCQVKIN